MALTLKNSYNYKSTHVPSFMLLSKSAQSIHISALLTKLFTVFVLALSKLATSLVIALTLAVSGDDVFNVKCTVKAHN